MLNSSAEIVSQVFLNVGVELTNLIFAYLRDNKFEWSDTELEINPKLG